MSSTFWDRKNKMESCLKNKYPEKNNPLFQVTINGATNELIN